MRKLLAFLLFTIFCAPLALHAQTATAVPSHVIVFSMDEHGIFTPLSWRTGMRNDLRPATEEELQAALTESEDVRRLNETGKVAVRAADASGAIIFRTVLDIHVYQHREQLDDEGHFVPLPSEPVQSPGLIVAVPLKAVTVTLETWLPRSEQTFDIDHVQREMSRRRPVEVETTAKLPYVPNRINMVIFSDGYIPRAANTQCPQQTQTAPQTNDDCAFNFYADAFQDHYFTPQPYSRYKSFFHTARQFVTLGANDPTPQANQIGANHPLCPRDPDHIHDTREGQTPGHHTPFDSEFCHDTQTLRLLAPKVESTALSTMSNSVDGMDIPVIIVNDTLYGGAGGSIATVSINSQAADIGVHEVGHSFFKLGDEYAAATDNVGAPPPCDDQRGPVLCKANLTTCPSCSSTSILKWNRWVTAPTPTCSWSQQHATPTQCTPATPIGAFEGADHYVGGLYRPKLDCAMRTNSTPFCEVCREAAIRKIYEKITPWDALDSPTRVSSITRNGRTTPNSYESTPVSVGTPVAFGASLLALGLDSDGQAHPWQITWSVDGLIVPETTFHTYIFTPRQPNATGHKIVMEIVDPTVMVKEGNQTVNGVTTPLTKPTWRIEWTLYVQATATARSNGTTTPVAGSNTITVPKGTASLELNYTIETAEVENTNGDPWTVTVGYAPQTASGSVSALAGEETLFYREGHASKESDNQTYTEHIDLGGKAANGPLTLIVSVTVADQSATDAKPTSITAGLIGTPLPCGNDCDFCTLNPGAPECNLLFHVTSAELEPLSPKATNGDNSFWSVGGGIDLRRRISMHMSVPSNATSVEVHPAIISASRSTVAFLNVVTWNATPPAGQPNTLGRNGDSWSFTLNGGSEAEEFWFDIFTFGLDVIVKVPDSDDLRGYIEVDHIVSGENPSDPRLISRPLHALWHDRRSNAIYHWWTAYPTHLWLKDNVALLNRADRIADEHAGADTPPRHEWASGITELPFYMTKLWDEKYDQSKDFKEFRHTANVAAYGTSASDRDAAKAKLVKFINDTRAHVDKLTALTTVSQVYLGTGRICSEKPGSLATSMSFPDTWLQEVIQTGQIHNQGWLVLDLSAEVGNWVSDNAHKVTFDCDYNLWNDVILNRCSIGQLPGPCTGRRFLVRPTHITTSPGSVTINSGETATLAVDATGDNLHYRWYSGTAGNFARPLDNSDHASQVVSPESTQPYWVYVWGDGGSEQSTTATVTVAGTLPCEAPVITGQPPSERIISAGQGAFLAVSATGTNLHYQWMRADWSDTYTPIEGANLSSYVATGGGTYKVVVSNGCGSAESDVSVVIRGTSCLAPGIIGMTADQTMVVAGQPLSLWVVANGNEPLTYVWYEQRPGGDLTPISNQRELSVIPPVDGTLYAVGVGNECGHITSQPAFIYVCTPPAITQMPVPPIFTNERETGSMHIEVAGTHLSYQWFNGGAMAGTGPDVLVGALSSPQTFRVLITNECGTIDSGPIVVPAICKAPAITQQPIGTVIAPGGTAHLSVTATGNRADNSDITGYQWYRGNAPDTTNPLGTTSSIDVTPAATTPYWVAVKGNCAAPGDVVTYSTTATVTVCAPPSITSITDNVHIAAGQQASLNVIASGTSLTYQWFEGATGDTSKPQSGTAHILTPSPAVTTSYWARVTSQGVCTIDTATLTVHVCRPAVITTQPAPVTVASGASTTLRVITDAAPADAPSHFNWFEGAVGDVSHPAGTDASTLTVTPSADTSYWVRIWRDVCSIDSNAASVTVCALTASVDNEALISVGQSVILHSYVSNARPDAQMLYSWYQGNTGDRTNLVASSPQSANIEVHPSATTTYWLEVSDGTCTVTAGSTIVRLCVPRITTQPTGLMINAGQSAHLSVTADGGTLTYQWYTGTPGNTNAPVSGATAASVDVSPASVTSYWVRVTGSCSRYADSTAATVTICAPPSITHQPSPSSITRGQSTTVAITASGDGLSYQWYSGAVGVTTSPFGTNAASQSVAPQVTTDYWVRVTGTCGTQDSAGVKVSVAPIFTTQPASVRVTSGTSATFSVTIDGTQLSYQWFAGNSPYGSAINGATNASYTTPPLAADAVYYVRVTSGNYVANSNDATATICVANGVSLGQGASQTSGAAVTLSIVNPSGTDTYAWYRGNSGDTTNLISSGTPTGITVYPTATTNYWVRQTGGGCSANSPTITVPICTPTITAQPQNASIVAGSTATLSVTATGTPTLLYQWYSGAVGTTTSPVANGSTATVTVQPGSTLSYWCRVTSPNGCYVNSNGVTVTVCNPPSITTNPSNPTITRGQLTTLGVAASGSNLQYQWYQGTVGVTTLPMGTSSTQQVNPQVTTDYWVKVSNTCGSQNSTAAKVSVYPIFNSQPQPVLITRGTSATFSVAVDASQVTYQWYQGQPNTGTLINGATNASYTTPALTADTSYYVRVTSGNAVAYSDGATASIFVSPSVTYSQNAGQTSGAAVTLSIVNPNGTDTYAWYRGNSGDTSSFIVNTGTSGVLVQSPTQSTNYWVRTTRGSCYADSTTLTIPICTPAITAQPQNAGVIAPNSTTLSVTATGDPTLTYQWYTGTSGTTTSPINGATGNTVTVAPGQNTSYWVRVTNGTNPAACGVNSNTATVTVCNIPTITKQPTNAYVPQGWTTTTVGVTATGATSYTWYRGQAGDTSHVVATVSTANYTFSPGVTDYYWVRVSNSCGYRDSTACLVSVYPIINSAPQDVHLSAGSIATFTINASGGYLHYQWTMNGAYVGTDSPVFSTVINADASIGCTVTSGMTSTAAWAAAYVCSGPNVTSGPFKTGTGSCRTLSIASDDYSATYQWYRGARGDTSSPVTSYVCPTTSTTYWCRITSGDGSGCYTDSNTITVP